MQNKIDDPDAWEAGMSEARRIVFRMLECDKPIIARVNGHAVGLGATMALLCDIIVAADHANIGDPHVNAGLGAGDGGALIWPQLIGFARAKEYLFTGFRTRTFGTRLAECSRPLVSIAALWGTDWTRAVGILTYQQGVEAFRITGRLSDSERAALMSGTLQGIYDWHWPAGSA